MGKPVFFFLRFFPPPFSWKVCSRLMMINNSEISRLWICQRPSHLRSFEFLEQPYPDLCLPSRNCLDLFIWFMFVRRILTIIYSVIFSIFIFELILAADLSTYVLKVRKWIIRLSLNTAAISKLRTKMYQNDSKNEAKHQ